MELIRYHQSHPPLVKHVLAPQNEFGMPKTTWSNYKRMGFVFFKIPTFSRFFFLATSLSVKMKVVLPYANIYLKWTFTSLNVILKVNVTFVVLFGINACKELFGSVLSSAYWMILCKWSWLTLVTDIIYWQNSSKSEEEKIIFSALGI